MSGLSVSVVFTAFLVPDTQRGIVQKKCRILPFPDGDVVKNSEFL